MIELYKKGIWKDDKTVNVLAEGCLNDNPKICTNAIKFFLTIQHENEEDEDEDTDSENEGKSASDKIMDLKKRKGSKMTKHRASKVEKLVKQHKRKEKRRNKVKVVTDFLPIDLIFDPQTFTEKLYQKLRRS